MIVPIEQNVQEQVILEHISQLPSNRGGIYTNHKGPSNDTSAARWVSRSRY